jgi:hypothetical protein
MCMFLERSRSYRRELYYLNHALLVHILQSRLCRSSHRAIVNEAILRPFIACILPMNHVSVLKSLVYRHSSPSRLVLVTIRRRMVLDILSRRMSRRITPNDTIFVLIDPDIVESHDCWHYTC